MRAVIIANGSLEKPEEALAQIFPEDIVIAADGGSSHCRALGIVPNLIIGDLDSITPDDRRYWEGQGVEILPHDVRKDETDLELAFLYALEHGMEEALVLAALGGRWDQTFANLLLPGYTRLKGLMVSYWHAGLSILVVHGRRMIRGRAGQTVSLVPVGGDVHGVRTEGLEWPLSGETLSMGATRGISNVLLGELAVVEVSEGTLLCFVFDDDFESEVL